MGYQENLNNIGAFEYNASLTNNTDELLVNMVQNANDQTGNLWYFAMMLSFWFILIFFFFKKDEEIRLDILRSIFVASGWCLFLSSAMVLSEIATSIMPTMWFGIIWFLTRVAIFNLENKNQ